MQACRKLQTVFMMEAATVRELPAFQNVPLAPKRLQKAMFGVILIKHKYKYNYKYIYIHNYIHIGGKKYENKIDKESA